MEPECKANILLVDDNEDNLITFEAMLSDLGENIVKARSGREALRCVLEQDFAVILLDVRMPGMDGFETAEIIRKREKSQLTPIVFLSAVHTSDAHKLMGYSIGAFDYVIKPVVPEILKAKVAVFVDLYRKTRQVERQRYAEEANRAKDEFLCHVSHELRSPLAAIYEFATILLDGLAGEVPDGQREYLETILRNVTQLKTMIDDLLSVSRTQTGKLTVRPRYLTVAEPIGESLESRSTAALAKGINLSSEIGDDLPPAYADGRRVEQIVTNLINNAVKFTPQNGSITVRAGIDENGPDFLCISVSDTGCGISEEERERIFEQMYQIRYDGDAGRKGLGLGLYICKELVSCQGGRIWVESRIGQGSTFFFTLPIFSLAKTVGPVLTDANLPGGAIALITVDVASIDDRALEKLERAAMEEVWDILDRCIIRVMDVILPRMPGRKTGETFYVVACGDEDGVESMVQRIRWQLAGCDALKTAGLAATVFFTMMDIPPLTDNTTPEEIAKGVASRIEDLVMTPV